MSDLPTIEYVTAEKRFRRAIVYGRFDDQITRELHQFDPAADQWDPIGRIPLREIRVNGEPRSPVDLLSDGGGF